MEILLVSEIIVTCTGTFIRSTGEILTAAHCLFPGATICDFDPELPGYPFPFGFSFAVEVMGVNGTSDKLIFPFEVVAYSGITDVAILKPMPLTRADNSVISVVNQEYFDWGRSQELSRGQDIMGLSFDVAFLKKLSHLGPVQAADKDRGTSFAVSVEQVFVDTDIQPGASGTGLFNADRKLVLAPLSYRWDYIPEPIPGGNPVSTARLTASGTSSRVSHRLTNRMLNPNTPPNGANNEYLIPGLGIIPTQVMSGINLYTDWGADYVPYVQDKGIIFAFLASQDYFEFIWDLAECSPIMYTVTPPSMLGAPVDQIISGTPPDPFIDFPGGTPSITGTMTILEAIEGHLDHNDWHQLGEDAGLTTVTGILMHNDKVLLFTLVRALARTLIHVGRYSGSATLSASASGPLTRPPRRTPRATGRPFTA